jgi:hypothetical protein
LNARRQAGNSFDPKRPASKPPAPPIPTKLNSGAAGDPPDSSSNSQDQPQNQDILSALAGTEAGRDRVVANRTRRVILSSLGVMREEREGRSRARGLALAVLVLVPLLIAPLLWEVTDSFIAGEHPGDPGSQLTLWAGVVCCALLAAALVAGWWKNRA